jgi:hypothetical protein
MVQHEHYHYSLALEHAMRELYGSKSRWYQSAGSYSEPKEVREALLAATKCIRARVEDIITIDSRLEDAVGSTLDGLEKEICAIGKQDNQLDIIARLLMLVAYLLGYGRMTGKPIREVVYFQTAGQARYDDHLAQTEDFRAARALEVTKRREIAGLLHGQGLSVAQIAHVMKIPGHQVRDYLRDAQQDGEVPQHHGR